MEEKIICPKCKGFGEVNKPKIRTKCINSDNTNEKFCSKCKIFKNVIEFYKNKNGNHVGYCKHCQIYKRSEKYKKNRRENIRKFEGICKLCSIKFMGYKKDQRCCSRHCHLAFIGNHINKNKLSNEVNEQLKNEGFYTYKIFK